MWVHTPFPSPDGVLCYYGEGTRTEIIKIIKDKIDICGDIVCVSHPALTWDDENSLAEYRELTTQNKY